MPDRDPQWRDTILKADGYCSQISGFDGRDEQARANLTAHHLERRGMGGIPSRDTIENGITLTNEEHAWEHAGAIIIHEWDREGGELIVEDVQGVLGEPGFIPQERLWFYAGRLKKELEAEEGLIVELNGSDREVARLYWRRWVHKNFKLVDSEAPSFRAYTEARDWPTNRAEKLAKLYDFSRTSGVEWLPGETSRAYAKRIKTGGESGRAWFYARIPAGAVTWYRTSNEGALRDTMQPGDVLIKAGKVVYGARADDGKLFGPDGGEIAVERSA